MPSETPPKWVVIQPASFRTGSSFTFFLLDGAKRFACRMTWN